MPENISSPLILLRQTEIRKAYPHIYLDLDFPARAIKPFFFFDRKWVKMNRSLRSLAKQSLSLC